jgi:hypothetical protein
MVYTGRAAMEIIVRCWERNIGLLSTFCALVLEISVMSWDRSLGHGLQLRAQSKISFSAAGTETSGFYYIEWSLRRLLLGSLIERLGFVYFGVRSWKC